MNAVSKVLLILTTRLIPTQTVMELSRVYDHIDMKRSKLSLSLIWGEITFNSLNYCQNYFQIVDR